MSTFSERLAKRLSSLRQAMASRELDAFILSERPNSHYLSGFPCSNSFLVIGEQHGVFLTDFRYLEKAEASISTLQVQRMTQNSTQELADVLRQIKPKRIGFEGSVSYSRYQQFRKAAGRSALVEAEELISQMRSVKDSEEIELIASNQKLNEAVWRVALRQVDVGTSELALRQSIRAEMNRRLLEEAFETIVAFGPNSSVSHAVSSTRRLRKGDSLLVDMGIKREYYHSDMTRTVCLGAPHARLNEIYSVVLEAQQKALACIRPGVLCSDVDAAARTTIDSAGFGEYFGHGLGHGVGLEIHEAPTLNPRSQQQLVEGMVITVEPGIYLPGFGGVRTEDLVVVTSDGYRNLTAAPKRLVLR